MRYSHHFILSALAVLGWMIAQPVSADVATQGAVRPAVVIVEGGVDAEKRPVYSITTKSAEITEVLRAVFTKAGVEYSVDQDVLGPVDLNLKNRTIDEILVQIQESARPPIKIARGNDKVYRVSRDYALEQKAAAVQLRMNGGGPGGFGSGQMGPSGSQASPYAANGQFAIPSDKLVTLIVPDSRPIPLSQAIARISAQTGFPIMLDKRVPQDVMFSGRIESSSLNLALPALAEVSGLRLVMSNGQATLMPTDAYTIRVNNMILGQTGMPCRRCGQPMWSTWNFCPNCGQATSRAILLPNQTQNQAPGQLQNQSQGTSRPQRGSPNPNNPVRKIDR